MGKPVELLAKDALASLLHDRRLPLSLDALLYVGGVATLEGVDPAVMDLPHSLADLIEKPTVVRHDEERPLPRLPAPF